MSPSEQASKAQRVVYRRNVGCWMAALLIRDLHSLPLKQWWDLCDILEEEYEPGVHSIARHYLK